MALALGKLTTGTPKFRGSGFVGMHVKPITAQEKFNFPRANAILSPRTGIALGTRLDSWHPRSQGLTADTALPKALAQNTTQKSISIVFSVSSIRHDSSLSKYRKQKQSPPGRAPFLVFSGG